MKRISLIFVVSLAGLITARLGIPVRAQGQLTTRPNEMKVVELVRAVENGIVRVDEVGAVSVLDATTNTFVEKAVDTHAGTGFVIQCQSVGTMDIDVFIVTNDHVASDRAGVFRGERNLYVRPKFGRRQAVELVGVDALSDLAVLKVRVPIAAKDSWRAFAWSPNLPQVGEDVVAVGFGQSLRGSPSVTKGIISALDRFLPYPGRENGRFAGLVQTDAVINPGNSGGPLVNLRGEIVGVNTYRHAEIKKSYATGEEYYGGLSAGIYFARATESAQRIIEQLITEGRVFRPALGLTVRTLTTAESYKNDGLWDGVLVESVDKSSPADVVGIEAGDLIGQLFAEPPKGPLHANGMLLRSEGDWNNALARCSSKRVVLGLDGKARTVPATVYILLLRKKDGFAKAEHVELPFQP